MKQRCNECNKSKKPCVKLPPQVLEIVRESGPVIFHRVDVPAEMGDDTEIDVGSLNYKNVLLYFQANHHAYLFSSDGIPTRISVDPFDINSIVEALEELGAKFDELEEFAHTEVTNLRDITGNLQRNLEQEVADREQAVNDLDAKITGDIGNAISELQSDLANETTARENADQNFQEQIDAIESKSDVVDIVDTYAQLQSYATASLGDNDVIKVLQDETHDGAISYYRWDKTAGTWNYVGSVGPYYTKSETDEKITEAIGDGVPKLPIAVIAGTSTDSGSLNAPISVSTDSQGGSKLSWYIYDTTTGRPAGSRSFLPDVATANKNGYMSAQDKRNLDALVEGGGGSSVELLSAYSSAPTASQAYDAGYVNSRLDSEYIRLGQGTNRPKNADTIIIGNNASDDDRLFSSIVIGPNASDKRGYGIALGRDAVCDGQMSMAIGPFTGMKSGVGYSVALGCGAKANRAGEVSIGDPSSTEAGRGTRYLANVRAGELDTDAVNFKQMKDYVAEHGGGGGGSVELAEEYGNSSTIALSQKFISSKLNGKTVEVGNGSTTYSDGSVAIGNNAIAGTNGVTLGANSHGGFGSIAIGETANAGTNYSSSSPVNGTIAIGRLTNATHLHSVALGQMSLTSRAYEVSVGGSSSWGYNSRYLANVKDGELPQDAVTVNQLNTAIGNVEAVLARLSDGAGV